MLKTRLVCYIRTCISNCWTRVMNHDSWYMICVFSPKPAVWGLFFGLRVGYSVWLGQSSRPSLARVRLFPLVLSLKACNMSLVLSRLRQPIVTSNMHIPRPLRSKSLLGGKHILGTHSKRMWKLSTVVNTLPVVVSGTITTPTSSVDVWIHVCT